jgi:DNA-binding NarL/FixJ family response regulator
MIREAAMNPAVLVVEDEPTVRIGYETIVTEAGFAVAGSAGTAVEALRAAQATRPAAALLDLNLGANADGLWLARELAMQFGTQIVFVTGSNDQRILGAATLLGAAAVLHKPAMPLEIIGALLDALAESTRAEPQLSG